jgi:hypothetical protein
VPDSVDREKSKFGGETGKKEMGTVRTSTPVFQVDSRARKKPDIDLLQMNLVIFLFFASSSVEGIIHDDAR